jgi:hypothetical protein
MGHQAADEMHIAAQPSSFNTVRYGASGNGLSAGLSSAKASLMISRDRLGLKKSLLLKRSRF